MYYFDLLEGSTGSFGFTGSYSCAIPYVEQTQGKMCSLIYILYCVNFLSVNKKSAGTGGEDEKRCVSKNTKAWICCSISVGFSVEAVFAEGEKKYIYWGNVIHLHTYFWCFHIHDTVFKVQTVVSHFQALRTARIQNRHWLKNGTTHFSSVITLKTLQKLHNFAEEGLSKSSNT